MQRETPASPDQGGRLEEEGLGRTLAKGIPEKGEDVGHNWGGGQRPSGLGSSKMKQLQGPVLPLAVCRSTSTVGLPLESRISRAKIFCMAMAARQEV